MGDADDTLPPSKKRAAGRELSRDNPDLDDEEEDIFEQETGTFKKASEEVLANRRIVKVHRNQTSSAPSSNPFASIRLVPPKDSTATQDTAKTALEESKDNVKTETEKDDGVVQEPKSKIDQETAKTCKESQDNAKKETEKEDGVNQDPKSKIARETVRTETEKEEDSDNQEPKSKIDQETKTGCEESQDNAKLETEKEDGVNQEPKSKIDEEKQEDVKKPESADAEATKEIEKNKNLEEIVENTETASVNSFGRLSSCQNAFTGLVGTGFSSSTCSFGSVTSFSFGNNGNKIPSLQETRVETGEENEKAIFTSHSVLFEFLDGVWKERGKGELKVNISTTGTTKARLVMRSKGNYRLILNASLFPDMKLTNMEKKGVTFTCLNSTGEEEKDSFSTFALKFKDASIVEEFRATVMKHKGDTDTAASLLKTPENSPKALDE